MTFVITFVPRGSVIGNFAKTNSFLEKWSSNSVFVEYAVMFRHLIRNDSRIR